MSGGLETPLSGGNINTVVAVGNTVRRQTTAATPTIHRFLAHLHRAGFQDCPKALGIDDQGREVLSLEPGSPDAPPDLWTDLRAPLAAVSLLRRFHDASVGFDAGPGVWAYAYPDPTRHEVIGHNDFAPYNMLFENGNPVTILDFDLCGPAPRLRDLAYLIYWLAPFSFASDDHRALSLAELRAGCPRARALCQSYGPVDRDALVAMISEVLHHMGNRAALSEMVGDAAAARLADAGHLDHWQREAAAFDRQRAAVHAALTDENDAPAIL